MISSFKKKRGERKALALILSFVIVFTAFGASGTVPASAAPNDGTGTNGLAELRIASVEELTSGEIQTLYRDEVYRGIESNGEDPDKYNL